MIKKLLLTAAFVLPLFSAESFIYDISKYMNGDEGVYRISSKYEIFPDKNYKTNWVGVYKKGASNDWGNVLQWSWAKDLKQCSDNNNARCINIGGLKDGQYDIRYFLNNSYITDYSKTVKLETVGLPKFIKITNTDSYNGKLLFDIDASSKGDKTWVGVYKKGTSNAWKNVLAWTWYDASRLINSVVLPNPVPNTTYELRLFYNNSYKLEAKVEYKVGGDVIDEPKIFRAEQRPFGVIFETTTSGKGNKDWVGLYKVGASNSWNNVKAWSWVDVEPKDYGKGFSVDGLPSGEYELRLFYHNSYKVEAVKRITLKH